MKSCNKLAITEILYLCNFSNSFVLRRICNNNVTILK